MANKRIKDLTEKSTFASGDYFPVDNNNGTKKVDAGKITVPLGNISGSADAYSSTKAYKVGDLVIHNNMLYKCTTACSAGTWQTNQGYFTATTLTSEVTNVNSSLMHVKIFTGTVTTNTTTGGVFGNAYSGSIAVSAMTGYDADVWSSKKVAIPYSTAALAGIVSLDGNNMRVLGNNGSNYTVALAVFY